MEEIKVHRRQMIEREVETLHEWDRAEAAASAVPVQVPVSSDLCFDFLEVSADGFGDGEWERLIALSGEDPPGESSRGNSSVAFGS